MTELGGVIPIAVTPFDDSGRVDEASIVTLVDFEARCGVHGLTVLGIMGEAQVYRRFRVGDVAGAAAVFDRYASVIRYEGQQGIGLVLRKETLRLRGAIASSAVRSPGAPLDDVTRAELEDTLSRAGLLAR
ncbi:MAG: dihydrodipicolinate synthase family protein [Candidatus Rokubacteria bacterium]|nr:dihydrodipicolinate synthase family protein [Candidatus Rokubacteria bacterium]